MSNKNTHTHTHTHTVFRERYANNPYCWHFAFRNEWYRHNNKEEWQWTEGARFGVSCRFLSNPLQGVQHIHNSLRPPNTLPQILAMTIKKNHSHCTVINCYNWSTVTHCTVINCYNWSTVTHCTAINCYNWSTVTHFRRFQRCWFL